MHQHTKWLSAGMRLLAVFAWLTVALNLPAENWPNWRGPSFNGSSPERNLPAEFSKTNGVQWIAELPGPSAATPAIWGDRVFVSSTDDKAKNLHAFAFDRRNGKLLWRHEVSIGFNKDNLSNFASPSPLTDGKLVWFYYGNGDLAAFTVEGKPVWTRNIQKDYGPFAYQWTYAASPLLHDGKLFIQVLQRNVPVQGRGRTDGSSESYLLALDPQTGKELWRHVRPSDASQESLEAYSTPLPLRHDGGDELVIVGGDCISGHESATGKELWRWGTWNPTRIGHWRLVPSAVAGGGVVLACAPKGAPVYAVKLGGQGTLDDSGLAWISKEREVSSDVATPLFYENRFYILNGDRRVLSRVEPATGKVEWTGELGRGAKIEASPTGADGKIYFMDHRGTVYVVEAGSEFRLLHTTNMADEGDDRLRSSVAVSQGNLFIRTGSKVYCIGR